MLDNHADAGLDVRKAIGSVARWRNGFSPDEALEDFVARHCGPPALGRREDEPVLVYAQERGPALAIGAYGSEARVRAWLPGLPKRLCPATVLNLKPIAARFTAYSTHQPSRQADIGELPIPLLTRRDAGRYLTMGFILAGFDDRHLAFSAHRMLVLGHDRVGLWMLRDRRLRDAAEKAHSRGKPLPISINIGIAPSAAIASATSTAIIPDRMDKLSLAGALAGSPIQLCEGQVPGVCFLSTAEIVLEGHILPDTVPEAQCGAPLGASMPEFLGYDGNAQSALQVVKLSRMRFRPKALFQTVTGPGREQSVILGLGGALSLSIALRHETGIHDLRFSHAGGGMLLLFVALETGTRGDLGELARQIIKVCPFTKTIIFVDKDVDLSNEEDIFWAVTTRANLPRDCHALPGFPAIGMDPSQTEPWSKAKGPAPAAFRSYIDATVPAELAAVARRSFGWARADLHACVPA